jgi:hypothetical protein
MLGKNSRGGGAISQAGGAETTGASFSLPRHLGLRSLIRMAETMDQAIGTDSGGDDSIPNGNVNSKRPEVPAGSSHAMQCHRKTDQIEETTKD